MVARLKNVQGEITLSSVGGKAFNLIRLKEKNFLIPNFEIVPISYIKDFLNDIGVKEVYLNQILKDSQEQAFDKLDKIRKKINRSKFDNTFIEKVEGSIRLLKGEDLIVRSSATSEDGATDSFAGIYESYITKNEKEDTLKNIKKIILSLFSERAYLYLSMKKINEFPLSSVIVQEFIKGDFSGIMFTDFSRNGEKGILLNLDRGTAKPIVEGKSGRELFIKNGEVEKDSLLDNNSLNELTKVGKDIEQFFKFPQDIEWTIKNSKIYILQSRPITESISKEVRVWDNSNIAESYSGIVLPLTSSYARHIYKVTYIDLARKSGLSFKKIRENKQVFENLLGFFYGRFYYNILNWYRMMTLFPRYESNKGNLDKMISAKSKAELDKSYNRNVSFLFKVKYYSILVLRYPLFENEVNRFKDHVKKYLKDFKKFDLASMSNKELMNLYYSSMRELLDKWSVTVENDFLLMTFFGSFQKLTKKINISEEQKLNLISEINNVISAEQVNSIIKVSKEFSKNKNLITLANKGKYTGCLKEIKTNGQLEELRKGIDDYLNDYGGRFANELRLETEDFDTNPEYLIRLLNLYKNKEVIEINKNSKKDKLPLRLSVIEKIKIKYLIRKIKHYARRREELRLLRSQSFSLARSLFTHIGKNLEKQGMLDSWRDVFYLETDEIKYFIEGSSTIQDLNQIVSLRKKQYNEFSKVELKNVFVTEGDPYTSLSTKIKGKDKNVKNMKGQGCSHGVIKGKVKVLDSFELPDKDEFEIIVTKHTDPGWTPLFGLCKGIIVEHGGLLSHAAIISRELNLPCVIGVDNATQKLKDGQIVSINGATGEIKIHGRN